MHNYSLEQMLSMTYMREQGFRFIISELTTRENPIILETGSSRVPDPRWGTFENNFKDDGMSTLIWDAYIQQHGGELYSVDIDPSNIDYTQKYVGRNTKLYCMDSLRFLWEKRVELDEQDLYVDLLYLDSLHDPVHHLKELCAIMPRLSQGTLVAVDDNYGKADDRATLIHEFMNSIGIDIAHSGVQKIWKLT